MIQVMITDDSGSSEFFVSEDMADRIKGLLGVS